MYANNNPYRYIDTDGQIPVDTVWDAVSIVYDISKMTYGYFTNNPRLVKDGATDFAGDIVALFLPYVPAGSTKLARTAINAVTFTQQQLAKKFKHAPDFGVNTAKKNPNTYAKFEAAIKDHLSDAATKQKGTYGFVEDSKVFFNSKTNNVVVVDKTNNFVTGFKLSPGTKQFENYKKNGLLR